MSGSDRTHDVLTVVRALQRTGLASSGMIRDVLSLDSGNIAESVGVLVGEKRELEEGSSTSASKRLSTGPQFGDSAYDPVVDRVFQYDESEATWLAFYRLDMEFRRRVLDPRIVKRIRFRFRMSWFKIQPAFAGNIAKLTDVPPLPSAKHIIWFQKKFPELIEVAFRNDPTNVMNYTLDSTPWFKLEKLSAQMENTRGTFTALGFPDLKVLSLSSAESPGFGTGRGLFLIQGLPNLETLILESTSTEGTWTLVLSGQFPRLRTVKLASIDFVSDYIPFTAVNLENLIVQELMPTEYVPSKRLSVDSAAVFGDLGIIGGRVGEIEELVVTFNTDLMEILNVGLRHPGTRVLLPSLKKLTLRQTYNQGDFDYPTTELTDEMKALTHVQVVDDGRLDVSIVNSILGTKHKLVLLRTDRWSDADANARFAAIRKAFPTVEIRKWLPFDEGGVEFP